MTPKLPFAFFLLSVVPATFGLFPIAYGTAMIGVLILRADPRYWRPREEEEKSGD